MKVAYILDNFDRGGIGILLLDTCELAKDNNLNLTIISLGKSGSLEKEFENSKCKLIKINRKNPIDFKIIILIRRIIKEENINILHAHQPVEGIHAYLASLGTDTKTVLSFHGYIPSLKDDLVARFLIPRVSANIAVSFGFLERLKKEANFGKLKNFHVVYNGVNYQKIQNAKDKNILSNLSSKNSFKLGMVGNFNSTGRDQMTVCKALPSLLKEYQNLHFFFIGAKEKKNPQYFDDCFNFCKNHGILERTHFMGSRKDVYDLLKELDIFVYSSHHDSFGISVIEAMLSGIPTIVNDLPPLLEITHNGLYAEIFKSGNPESLKTVIEKLIDNVLLRNQLSFEAKNWARKNFTIEAHIKNLINVYSQILQRN